MGELSELEAELRPSEVAVDLAPAVLEHFVAYLDTEIRM